MRQASQCDYVLFLSCQKKKRRTRKVEGGRWKVAGASNNEDLIGKDQQRDQPGKCLYYARAFWLYFQSHYRMRNVTLVCVLYAYSRRLTMALV